MRATRRHVLGLCALAAFTAVGARAQVDTVGAHLGHWGPPLDPKAALHPLTEVDPELQAGLERVLEQPPFEGLVRRAALSVALVDLTDDDAERFAGVEVDRMRYAASLPKIGILLGVFAEVEAGRLDYTPELRAELERMIRHSSNAVSSELIRRIGFEAIENAVRDPALQLYHEESGGGLWVGRGYGGLGVWRRDPVGGISHGATARQVARFLVMLAHGELLSPWASEEMRAIMSRPAIRHKFVRGLEARPGSEIYRKSGTWREYHADAALVERDGHLYAAVALLEGRAGGDLLSRLIVELDDLVHGSAGEGG